MFERVPYDNHKILMDRMNCRKRNEKRDDEVRLSTDVCAENNKVKLLGSASHEGQKSSNTLRWKY